MAEKTLTNPKGIDYNCVWCRDQGWSYQSRGYGLKFQCDCDKGRSLNPSEYNVGCDEHFDWSEHPCE